MEGLEAQGNDSSPAPEEENVRGALGQEAVFRKAVSVGLLFCEQLALLSARPQSVSLVLLLPLLLPLGPNWCAVAQRCPQACVCDNPRRHVACRHQNLTEVPTAIPEVSRARWGGGGQQAGPGLAPEDLPLPGWGRLRHLTFPP